jgi:uncharacterized radical SAM superfamily Fe-S cluster-containing enzyme
MATKPLPEKCLACGSTTGIYWDETVVYRQFASWDGRQTSSEYQRTVRINRTAHCAACDRGVRFDIRQIVND